MTFDSKMTFEKHLRLVSRQSFSKNWYLEEVLVVFHDRSLLERSFGGFVLPGLEYCSAVWCPAADTHLILDRAVSGARFLTGGVFECIDRVVEMFVRPSSTISHSFIGL